MEGIFHVHSDYSSDGELSLEQLHDECVRRSFRFVLVTDHAEDFSQERVKEFVEHCRKVSDQNCWLIPGLEFVIDKERQVHLLVAGIDESFSLNEFEDFLESLQGGIGNHLAVIAHLSRSNHYVPPAYEKKIDGIEVWNAAYDSRYLPDHKAMLVFSKLKKKNINLVGFGGLDLHDNSGFRKLKLSVTGACNTPTELIRHLKEGRFAIRGPLVSLSSRYEVGMIQILIIGVGRGILTVLDSVRWIMKGTMNKAERFISIHKK